MIEIIAKEGMWLTQSTLADENSRTFVKKAYASSADLWRDATPEEKAEWEASHNPDTPRKSREELIHEEIRAKYSENDELMILRQYNAHPDNPQYKEAFEAYNAYVEAILAKYPSAE